ncbi:hypothetical protein Micbo1qcDRAFT_197754 [Microdochium bolleyi]|uniref:DUF7357 domain-containing protein n=1 Tax=Microdochium bolleyi TaxID=196109 RepID=A0A136IS57_9PEZI|nr:hypothetical protein Micbo1qcDRAFT_197754 [Microdochium bolleyi]
MADITMRLRVVVQRNGLPETRYMLPVPLDGNPTIAKLLELVNSCTPIESDDWGLDDYTVELPAPDGSRNECLHFHPIRAVLKEDDQVFIRPLQTDDIRRRRISGRYQISSDGKHLVDGVAFGRPLLRAPTSRPAIFIPPRKRRRLLQNNEDDDEAQDGAENTQMLLLTNGEDAVDDRDYVDAGAELEADFSPSGSDSDSGEGDDEMDEDEDLDDELQELQRENAELDVDMDDSQTTQTRPDTRRGRPTQRDMNLEALDGLGALRAAFPAAPLDLCERVLAANHNDLKLAYINLKEAFDPALPETAVLSGNLFGTQSRGDPESSTAALPNNKQAAPETVDGQEDANDGMDDDENSGSGSDDDVPDFVKRYDRCGLPPGTISSGQGLASMAAITGPFNTADGQATSTTLRPTKIVFQDEEDPADTTSSSESSSSSESEDSSDDEASSDSDSEGDQGPQGHVRNLPGREETGDDSDSDDSSFRGGADGASSDDSSSAASDDNDSDSDSDSGPEETTTKQVLPTTRPKPATQDATSESSSDSSASDSDSSSDESSSDEEPSPVVENKKKGPAALPQPTVPPGQGKACTKSRNARRRAAQRAQREQQQSGQNVDMAVAGGDPTLQTADEKAAFEAKRQALLDALANGGIEIGPSGSTNLEQPLDSGNTAKRKREEEQPEKEQGQEGGSEQTQADTSKPAAVEASTPESQQKRQRFNLEVGKRLLFGALGLRAPKTSDDAEKLRDKLMKDVRPLVNARLEADKQKKEAEANKARTADDEDPDAWKEKINYRAVECCQEGIVLSEPPFPFVQRWDPQQQGLWNGKKNKRGGRGKKADRNQSHYYEEDNRCGKKRKHDDSQLDESYYDDTTFNGVADSPDDDAVLNYDDPVAEESNNGAQGEASQFTDMDDLPSLPADLKSLPMLQAPSAKAGMVITWKKWSCSAATQWQPLVSDVTAVVIRVENEGAALEVCLAKRDRHLDGSAKQYDELTGQRLYGKFEAPDIDDEDDDEELNQEQEDDGYRALDFTELLEPRIVQQPANDEPDDQPDTAQTNGNAHSNPAIGLTPSIEQSSGQATSPHDLRASLMAVDDKDEQDADINQVVPMQSGKSSMPFFENSSSNQAGQGHQDSINTGQDQLREPSPSKPTVDEQMSKGAAVDQRFMEDPSGYEGDLDTQMADHHDAIVNETQPGEDSSAHTPTPFHDAKSNASGPASENNDDDIAMFEDDDVITGTPTAARPLLKELSPMSSVASGRQPDPTTSNNVLEPDTYKIASGTGAAAEGLTADLRNTASGMVDPENNSFASDDVTLSKALRVQASEDADYEAAIRELDASPEPSSAEDEPSPGEPTTRIIKTEDGGSQPVDELSEDDELPPILKVATLKRTTSINAPISPPAIKSGRRSIGATPASAARGTSDRGQDGSTFSVPPGSRVISLLSSDAEDNDSMVLKQREHSSEDEREPVFTEDYADSDRDASYDPDHRIDVDSSLTRGRISTRKASATNGRSRTNNKKRSPVVRSSSLAPIKRSTRLSSQADGHSQASVIVLDSQQQSPPASAPVQSAFSAFKKGRKLGGSQGSSGSRAASGSNSSSSTAKRSWSGTVGASRF